MKISNKRRSLAFFAPLFVLLGEGRSLIKRWLRPLFTIVARWIGYDPIEFKPVKYEYTIQKMRTERVQANEVVFHPGLPTDVAQREIRMKIAALLPLEWEEIPRPDLRRFPDDPMPKEWRGMIEIAVREGRSQRIQNESAFA